LDADARVLLVGHRRHDHVAGQSRAVRGRRGEHAGRDAALHVVAAAPVQEAVAHPRRARLAHPLHADGVEVAVEHQRAPAAAAARAADDRRAPGRGLDHVHVEARAGHPSGGEAHHLRLAGAAGDERRVDRVDRDEVGDEAHDVRG
jgi:hypothetical protein